MDAGGRRRRNGRWQRGGGLSAKCSPYLGPGYHLSLEPGVLCGRLSVLLDRPFGRQEKSELRRNSWAGIKGPFGSERFSTAGSSKPCVYGNGRAFPELRQFHESGALAGRGGWHSRIADD